MSQAPRAHVTCDGVRWVSVVPIVGSPVVKGLCLLSEGFEIDSAVQAWTDMMPLKCLRLGHTCR